MPPRHAYWTILIDDQPTAFRAHDPEELLPTLNRLRERNESAVMKWFERGQLFDSRDAAKEAGMGRGERRWEGPRPGRDDADRGRSTGDGPGGSSHDRGARRAERERQDRPRDKNWRPGGEHRDPRQKYQDAKKAKWTRFKEKIRERHEERQARNPETFTPPHGDKFRVRDEQGGYRDRPRDDRREDRDTRDTRDPRRDDRRGESRDERQGVRPEPRREGREDRDGAPSRPHGDRFRDQRPRETWRGRDDDRKRGSWRDRPRDDNRKDSPRDGGDRFGAKGKPFAEPRTRDDRFDSRERGPSDWRDRPPRRDNERRDWKPKGPGGFKKTPHGKKPFGAKPGGSPRPGGGFRKGNSSRPPRRRRDDE